MKQLFIQCRILCAVFFVSGCIWDHPIKPTILANALEGNMDAVKSHIESGGNVDTADLSGETLLMMAVVGEQEEIVRYLLDKGANKKLRNKAGESALDIAERIDSKHLAALLQ